MDGNETEKSPIGEASARAVWIYWDHFLYLEELLLSSEKHVAFIDKNRNTISITFMHIILAACADIECILKEVFMLGEKCGIKEIRDKLKKEHEDFYGIKILISALRSEEQPWLKGESNGEPNPIWWLSYNAIKHNKNAEPYRGATLEHAISALAGLFSVNLVYYFKKMGKDFGQNIILPKLFHYPGLGADYRVTADSFSIEVPGFEEKKECKGEGCG